MECSRGVDGLRKARILLVKGQSPSIYAGTVELSISLARRILASGEVSIRPKMKIKIQ